jgi:hypothetical protein
LTIIADTANAATQNVQLKAAIADQTGVDVKFMIGFHVTSEQLSRRRLLSSYTWIVVYKVSAFSSAVNNIDSATLASNIATVLSSVAFRNQASSDTSAVISSSPAIAVPSSRFPSSGPIQRPSGGAQPKEKKGTATNFRAGPIADSFIGGVRALIFLGAEIWRLCQSRCRLWLSMKMKMRSLCAPSTWNTKRLDRKRTSG